MAITRAGSSQTSISTALSSLRKSFGGNGKSSSKKTATKSKINAPTAAELRRTAAKKTLTTLRLGISTKAYNYTPLSGSTFSLQV